MIPFGIQVAVIDNEADKESASGLLIPAASQEKPATGILYGIGYDVSDKFKDMADVGDTLVYKKNRGTVVEVKGIDYRILSEGEILCKV